MVCAEARFSAVSQACHSAIAAMQDGAAENRANAMGSGPAGARCLTLMREIEPGGKGQLGHPRQEGQELDALAGMEFVGSPRTDAEQPDRGMLADVEAQQSLRAHQPGG